MADAATKVRVNDPGFRDLAEGFVEGWARTLRRPDTRLLTFGPVWLVDFGEPTFGRTREFLAGSSPEETADIIEDVVPEFHHWVTAFTSTPDATRERYTARGYRFLRNEVLLRRDLEAPLPPPRQVTVEVVDDMEEARRVDADHGWDLIREEHLDDPLVHHYHVTVDEVAAARASVARTEGGIAVLNAVHTLPAYRGQGLARAVVTRAVEDARAEGATTALLAASEEGVPLYRRLGFDEAARAVVLEWPTPS